jgi:hypothetical protein
MITVSNILDGASLDFVLRPGDVVQLIKTQNMSNTVLHSMYVTKRVDSNLLNYAVTMRSGNIKDKSISTICNQYQGYEQNDPEHPAYWLVFYQFFNYLYD